jgi:hypothetical protein
MTADQPKEPEPTAHEETVSLDSLDPFERGMVIAQSLLPKGGNLELEYIQELVTKIGRNLGKRTTQRLVVARAGGDSGQITHAEKVAHHPSQDNLAELAGFASGAVVAFYKLARHAAEMQKADDQPSDTSETSTNTNQPKEQ